MLPNIPGRAAPRGLLQQYRPISTDGASTANRRFRGIAEHGPIFIARRSVASDVVDDAPPCLVGMEACGTAHQWAREVSKLGHTVRLMRPSYVKGYVKRSKNDAADAAAICDGRDTPIDALPF